MTRALLVLLSIMIMASPALSDEIDAKFKQARKYLKEEKLTITTTPKKAFMQENIVVAGQGVPHKDAKSRGQKKATAITAAKVVAQRRLAEVIEGVAIVSETTVKDSELQSDTIKTAVSAFIKGAQVAFEEYNDADESAVVILRVGMTGTDSFAALIYDKIMDEPKIKENLEKPVYAPPADVPPPPPAAKEYDGMIIDATTQNFRPALINRIFTQNGEVIYDPAKISQKVLVEQGCGEYTNTVDKAKAALRKRGVQNPLVVKAAGTVSPSDLQVSGETAASIFSANQKTGFMADARVAFVLK